MRRIRTPLAIQLAHERVLEAPAGAAPAHDRFADDRVPVSPRDYVIGSLSRARTADIQYPKLAG